MTKPEEDVGETLGEFILQGETDKALKAYFSHIGHGIECWVPKSVIVRIEDPPDRTSSGVLVTKTWWANKFAKENGV